jgi:uncharacterized membrane protein
MKRLSEIADLVDPSGHRAAHSKVMILGVTTAVVLIVGLVLLIKGQHFAWPDVAVLGLLLVAPYGLDGYKTLLKLRSRIPEQETDAAILRRRWTGAEEGVEPAP